MRKNKVPAMKAKRQTASKLRKAAKRKSKTPQAQKSKKLHRQCTYRGRGGTAGPTHDSK